MTPDIQKILATWWVHNFPDAEPDDAFAGMVEELGELARARLKFKQGIRGMADLTAKEVREAQQDAIGDLIIFAAHLCQLEGWQLGECVSMALNEVIGRDWRANPETGHAEEE